MVYLGIDIGTSFIKSGLLDTEKMEIKNIIEKKTPSMLLNSDPKASEYDADMISNIVLQIIQSFVGISDHQKLDGILFSTQMHGFVLTDYNGNRISNYISWQDERARRNSGEGSDNYCNKVNSLLDEEDIIKSGMRLNPGYSVCSLFYLYKNKLVPDNQPIRFFTLGDYVIFKLTGEDPYCHITNAASSGLTALSSNSSGWNYKMINRLGFSNIIFPDIIKENKTYCCIKINNQSIPIYPPVGDQQVAILGAGVIPGEQISINIGTGSQISIIDDKLSFGNYQTRPFFGGYYLRTVPNVPAGRALNVLLQYMATFVFAHEPLLVFPEFCHI